MRHAQTVVKELPTSAVGYHRYYIIRVIIVEAHAVYSGGPTGTRTQNPRIKKPVLYLLSYGSLNNMMLKNLMIIGDSYTFATDGEENYGWHLAQRLKLKLLHFGKRGCSNSEIFRRIISNAANINDDTLFIIGWSFPDRVDYYQHGNFHTLNEKADNRYAKEAYKNLLLLDNSNEPGIINTLTFMIASSGYLRSKKIPFLSMSAKIWNMYYDRDNNKIRELQNSLATYLEIKNPTSFGYIDDAIANGCSYSATHHLDSKGHKYVAERIITDLSILGIN